ncbi:unnamed protein product, partial [Sphacelaria rigidula]
SGFLRWCSFASCFHSEISIDIAFLGITLSRGHLSHPALRGPGQTAVAAAHLLIVSSSKSKSGVRTLSVLCPCTTTIHIEYHAPKRTWQRSNTPVQTVAKRVDPTSRQSVKSGSR